MKYLKWLICMSILFGHTPAVGEFFKYMGPDGTIHFTDDYSKVPKDKQIGFQQYIELEPVGGSNTASIQKPRDTSDYRAIDEKNPDNTHNNLNLDEIKNGLDLKKQELLEEYQTLINERKTLEEMRQSVHQKYPKLLNQRISDLNEKIENYEKKLLSYNEEVEQYNAKVTEKNKRILESTETTP